MHEGPKWRILKRHPDRIWAICLAGEAETSVLYTGSEDGLICSWDVVACEVKREFKGHSGTVTGITVSEDNVFSSSIDGTMICWSLKGEVLKVFKDFQEPVRSIACQGEMVVTGEADGTMKFFNIAGDGNASAAIDAHFDVISCLIFHQNEDTGNQVFSASYDKLIKSWDPATGTCSKIFRGHDNHVKCIAPVGSLLYSGGRDDTVRMWNAVDGMPLLVLPMPTIVNAIAFARGNLYCGFSDGHIRVLLEKQLQARLSKFQAENRVAFNKKKKELETKMQADIQKLQRETDAKVKAMMPKTEEVDEENEDEEEAPSPSKAAAMDPEFDETQMQEMQEKLQAITDQKCEQLRFQLKIKLEELAKKRDRQLLMTADELKDGKSHYVHTLQYDGPSVLTFCVSGKEMYVAADNEVIKTSSELNVIHL